MKPLYRLKALYISEEEAKDRENEILNIINETYPNLPNISQKEYVELINKCKQGDKNAREILTFVALKEGCKSLLYLYMKYDIDYQIEDALSDIYMINNKYLNTLLEVDSLKIFKLYARRITTNEFKRNMITYANKNLDVSERIYQKEQVDLDLIKLGDENDVVNEVFKKEFKESFDSILKTLSGKEYRTLKLYFGIDEKAPKTLIQVGECYGLSRERIRQITHKALRKLRHPSRAEKLEALDKELD